jgi:demethylmenaquinone methyltransferase/2-methoxy-6-polyprenyl-1,4-benzoquinol methylase
MATILRTWSYQYPWLYSAISRMAALTVGGEAKMRRLALAELTLPDQAEILDLCCGSGQTTQVLLSLSARVTGLDASPLSLQRARQRAPQASFVEAFAEKMPFAEASFDVVHTSLAIHEMEPGQRQEIFQEVYRVLRPTGQFTLLDFHRPSQVLLWPGFAVFLVLFETETSWQFLSSDLVRELQEVGFRIQGQKLYAGESLQVIRAEKI